MSRISLIRRASLAGAVLVCSAWPAMAQADRSASVFDRLFAPEATGPGVFTATVEHGQDSQSGNGPEALSSPIPLGMFFGVNPRATFTTEDVGLQAGGVFRRYADMGQFQVFDAHGGGKARYVGRRMTANGAVSAGYSPYSQFLTTESVESANGNSPDLAGLGRSVTSLEASGELGHQLSRYLMVSGGYRWEFRHYTLLDPNPALTNTQMHDAHVRLNRQIGRHTILFAGYGTHFSTDQAQGVEPLRTHDLNLGVDRDQLLRLSRRTTLKFSTGSSIVRVTDGHRFVLIGSLNMRHEFTRSWALVVAGGRGVGYLEGIADATVSQSATVSLTGGIGSRIDVLAESSYSNGDIGLTSVNQGFLAYSATGRVRGRLGRRTAAYVEWTLYDQRFDHLTAGGQFVSSLSRQGLRVGLAMNVPLQDPPAGQRGAR